MNDKPMDRETSEAKPLKESAINSEWIADNRKAIEEYYRSVELHGYGIFIYGVINELKASNKC